MLIVVLQMICYFASSIVVMFHVNSGGGSPVVPDCTTYLTSINRAWQQDYTHDRCHGPLGPGKDTAGGIVKGPLFTKVMPSHIYDASQNNLSCFNGVTQFQAVWRLPSPVWPKLVKLCSCGCIHSSAECWRSRVRHGLSWG